MKKWFNRLIKKLQDEDLNESEKSDSGKQVQENKESTLIIDKMGTSPVDYANKQESTKAKEPENTIELKEKSINIIAEKTKVIAYGNIKISVIKIHTKYDATSPGGLAASSVFSDEEFKEDLIKKLQKRNISVTKSFTLQVVHTSPNFENCTKINHEIGFEIIPENILRKKAIAKLTALLGFLWEEEYTIDPTAGKYYNIGRCKQPQLDNGYIINNDIAFIGPEENNDEKYNINANVSRAMAQIFYDSDKELFILRKSKFLPSGDITLKVVSVTPTGINTINLRHHITEVELNDNDQIIFNDKVSLLFNLVNDK